MTASIYLEAVVGLDVAPTADPETVFLNLADAFHELPDPTVRDLAFNATTHDVTMSFTFEGRLAPDEAVRRALSIGRTAFQAAELGTTNDTWDLARWNIVPSLESAVGRTAQPA